MLIIRKFQCLPNFDPTDRYFQLNILLPIPGGRRGSTPLKEKHQQIIYESYVGGSKIKNQIKGWGSKSVYFQRIASIWRYTDLFPHPLS